MSKNIAEYVGWLGALAILAAYLLVSFAVVKSDSAVYQLLNLGGGIWYCHHLSS